MACGIYEIRNKITDWKYIGSAVSIEGRWQGHRKALRGDYHHNKFLQRAWNKYGEEAFVFTVLEVCEKDNLLDREQSYFPSARTYRAMADGKFYNINPIAGSGKPPWEGHGLSEDHKKAIGDGNRGKKLTEETKNKIREAAKKRGIPEETRKKMTFSRKGYRTSEETKRKLSEAGKGRVVTEEARKKQSERMKGYKPSAETRKKQSDSMRGFSHSEETKAKMSATRKGREGKKHSEETKAKMSVAAKSRGISDETKKKMSETHKRIAAEKKAWMENWITVNRKPFGWRVYDSSHD